MRAAPHFTTSADETVSIPEACRRLAGISKATFYRIRFFKGKRVPVSEGRVGVRVTDINLYLALKAEEAS